MSYLRFVTCLFLLASCQLSAEEFEARVTKIVDGDSFYVMKEDGTQVRIRLAEVDAPESTRPWGIKATRALREKIGSQVIKLKIRNTDHWNRLVAWVWLDGIEVNKWLVQKGHAWVSRKYVKRYELLDDERVARESGQGLWSLSEKERLDIWLW